MKITFKLPQRVDTDSAQSVQKMIDDCLVESGVSAKTVNLTLDADDMEYISSAGLRVMLTTKKKVGELSVINASEEVCEIFNVTGFDEFINIEKKMEEISLEGLELVAAGGTARVYRLGEDRVVKSYYSRIPYEDITKEQTMIKSALSKGISTMIPFGLVKTSKGYGAVYELLNAKTILKCITEDPENEDMYLEKFVDFVKSQHEVDMTGLSAVKSVKKTFYDRIDKLTDSGFFTIDEAMTARQIIYSIPDKDTFVHGDCHIGNVMYEEKSKELYFIDMMQLSKGNPIFDIVGMAWMRLAPQVLDMERLEQMIGLDGEALNRIWRKIISLYFETTDNGIIDELDRQYSLLECLNLSMAELYAPGLFSENTLLWLKAEGMKAAELEF